MGNDRDGGSFFSFFLMGGIVGAIVGLLLAPRKGQETRADLSAKSEILKEQVEDIVLQAKDRLNPTIDNVKEMIRDKLADSRGEVLQDVTDEENGINDSESKE
jgi:gas vesicle protein